MANLRFHQRAALVSLAALAAIGPAHAQTTNLNALETAIVGTLAPRVTGFGYTIVKDGQVVKSGGGGIARPNTAFTAHTRVNVASVSKTITAVAVLQLLEKNGLTPEHPVAPWLPLHWSKGLGYWPASGLTFRDLLTHRSGMQQTIGKLTVLQPSTYVGLDTNTWAALQMLVTNGIAMDWAQTTCAQKNPDGTYSQGSPSVNEGYFGVWCYSNVNYSLMRAIIPRLWQAAGGPFVDFPPSLYSSAAYAQMFAVVYQAYVRQFVLGPLSIDAYCYSPLAETSQTRYYDARYPTASSSTSWNNQAGLLTCGAKNWNLSAWELAKIATYMRHAEWLPPDQQILSPVMRQVMDTLKLGWDRNSSFGRYWHGGKLMSAVFKTLVPVSGGWAQVDARREMESCIAKLPGNIQVAVVVNSSIRGAGINMPQLYPKAACTIVLEAYNAAST